MRKSKKQKLIKENDRIWSTLVRIRDNFTCQMCGKPSRHVQAHHIFGRSKKATRWETRNGISLCFYHHRYYVHGGRLSPEELIVFYKNLIGENEYERLRMNSQKIVSFSLPYVEEWNKKLRSEFLQTTGMTWEEWKREKKTS